MATAGSIVVDLLMRTGAFETDTKRAEKRLREMTKAAKDAGKVIGQALAIGATAATTALKLTIDSMDEMSKAAQKVGLPTEDFSKLSYAAGLADVAMETLTTSLGKLTKSQAAALKETSEQARVFEALGIAVKNADGSMRSSADVLADFADVFQAMKGSPEAMAAGFSLFGRSFQELIPLLKDGSAGIKDAGAELEALGGVLSTEAGQNAEQFNDDLTRLTTAAKALGMQIASDLLPDLIALSGGFVDSAKQGNNVKDVASDIADVLRGLGTVAHVISSAFEIMAAALAGVASAGVGAYNILKGIVTLDLSDIKFGANLAKEGAHGFTSELSEAFGGGKKAPVAPPVKVTFAGQGPDPEGLFAKSAAQVAAEKRAAETEKRLREALANKSTPKGKKPGGKSDAEREAEQVARAIEQMTKAQQDWQNELSETGNPIADEYASRLRYVTEQAKGFAEDGVQAEKVKAFTDEMQKLATSLRDADVAEFQKEFNEETEQMAASMQGPMKQALLDYKTEVAKIDEQLKLGIITIEDYNRRLDVLAERRDSPVTDVLDGIREEAELLKMTNEQQEIYNNLKAAGVTATSAMGEAIIAETEALQETRKQMEMWGQVEGELADTIFNLAKNIGDAENILKDFADSIADMIMRSIAEDWAGKITGWFKGMSSQGSGAAASGGATSGFDWGSLIGSLFGGGKAGGGDAFPGSAFLVGERGPEMFVPRTAGTIIPTDQTARAMGGGSGFYQHNDFHFAAPTSPYVQTQIAAKTAFAGQTAQRRN